MMMMKAHLLHITLEGSDVCEHQKGLAVAEKAMDDRAAAQRPQLVAIRRCNCRKPPRSFLDPGRSEEHTSELQSLV